MRVLASIGLTGLLISTAGLAEPVTVPPCEAANGFTPVCGFSRPPEDLETLPSGNGLLVSEYGALSGTRPGHLSVLDLTARQRQVIWPPAEKSAEPLWGDPTCTTPPGKEFSPHGVHLAKVNGSQRLLVVNHGGREAIEMFELTEDPTARTVALTWRGCVIAPDEAWINDVVNLPDGGVVTTNMIKRGTHEDAFFSAEATREDTGQALEWQAGAGWTKVPGSEGALPNGVQVSADGTTLYIAHYLGDRVIAVERSSGKRLWEAQIAGPDNVTMSPSGELLVASHRVDLKTIFECAAQSEVPCGAQFAVIAIDPKSGSQRTLFEGGGAPMGGATVALQVKGSVYMGSFTGERIVIRPTAP
jgi:hypothetical protein